MLGRLLAICLFAASAWGQTFTATPIDDLGTGNYLGFEGGLYLNGSNKVPIDHNADGLIFSHVLPINGKIVMLSIGMSIAADTFIAFNQQAQINSNVNHSTLTLLNGAQNDAVACYWTIPFASLDSCPDGAGKMNEYDRVKQQVLSPHHTTESQVEVVWVYDTDDRPSVSLPSPDADAYILEGYLGGIARAARARYPNLKLMFVTSREYGGYARSSLNPEPYAYEAGFAVKWLIEAQINQIRTGVRDPVAGNLDYNSGVAPWINWASYTWADGPVPRSDGFTWCDGQRVPPCLGEIDVAKDGLHPNDTGSAKLATLLLDYFLKSPYSPWFRASGK